MCVAVAGGGGLFCFFKPEDSKESYFKKKKTKTDGFETMMKNIFRWLI